MTLCFNPVNGGALEICGNWTLLNYYTYYTYKHVHDLTITSAAHVLLRRGFQFYISFQTSTIIICHINLSK